MPAAAVRLVTLLEQRRQVRDRVRSYSIGAPARQRMCTRSPWPWQFCPSEVFARRTTG
jgi:hypothetical protein